MTSGPFQFDPNELYADFLVFTIVLLSTKSPIEMLSLAFEL